MPAASSLQSEAAFGIWYQFPGKHRRFGFWDVVGRYCSNPVFTVVIPPPPPIVSFYLKATVRHVHTLVLAGCLCLVFAVVPWIKNSRHSLSSLVLWTTCLCWARDYGSDFPLVFWLHSVLLFIFKLPDWGRIDRHKGGKTQRDKLNDG